jgi:methylmalonyl-CoA mutase cobalamin-binding domain/chain
VPPLEKISEAILDLDEPTALRLVEEMITNRVDPVEILEECRRGMLTVGERFERGEMFLSEMIMASEIFKQVTERIKPTLKRISSETTGRVTLGTVEGDVHDIGKNIFAALLEADGFEVVDIGVDVPPERFLETIKEHKPNIVGMSSLLSSSLEAMRETVDAITSAGLRGRVKIIIGGGRVDKHAAEYIKPDAYSDNAAQGVKLCLELMRCTPT